MPRMHIILANGEVESSDITEVPSLTDIEQILGGGRTRIKVLFEGQITWLLARAHHDLRNVNHNARATAIAWTMQCQGRTVLPFKPLTDPVIYGTAILFEGIEP